jgi:DNA-binding XRE family transcriptional regulator
MITQQRNTFSAVRFQATLRVWRKMHELTVSDMSALAAIPHSTYGFIETGDRLPTINEFTKLCKLMEFDCAEFFER